MYIVYLYAYVCLVVWCLITKSCPTAVIPWTVVCQASRSMGFSRQEYWSGLPFSSPGNLPDPGIEPQHTALQADDLPTELYTYILGGPVCMYVYKHTHSDSCKIFNTVFFFNKI